MSCKHYSGTTAAYCEKCGDEAVQALVGYQLSEKQALRQRNKELVEAIDRVYKYLSIRSWLHGEDRIHVLDILEQALKGAK